MFPIGAFWNKRKLPAKKLSLKDGRIIGRHPSVCPSDVKQGNGSTNCNFFKILFIHGLVTNIGCRNLKMDIVQFKMADWWLYCFFFLKKVTCSLSRPDFFSYILLIPNSWVRTNRSQMSTETEVMQYKMAAWWPSLI